LVDVYVYESANYLWSPTVFHSGDIGFTIGARVVFSQRLLSFRSIDSSARNVIERHFPESRCGAVMRRMLRSIMIRKDISSSLTFTPYFAIYLEEPSIDILDIIYTIVIDVCTYILPDRMKAIEDGRCNGRLKFGVRKLRIGQLMPQGFELTDVLRWLFVVQMEFVVKWCDLFAQLMNGLCRTHRAVKLAVDRVFFYRGRDPAVIFFV
jgi:hypothetical protein